MAPRFEAVDYDPFKVGTPAPAPPAFEAVDYDPFAPQSSAPASAPSLSPTPQEPVNQPRYNSTQSQVPKNPQQRTLVPDPTPQIGPDTSPIGDTEPPGANPSEPWAFTKGFWTTVLEQNPKLMGEALESYSLLAGVEGQDPLASVLGQFGRDIKDAAQNPGQYKMSGVQFTDVNSLESLGRWAGESAGQALGSSITSIIPSMAGAAVGGRVGGRVGAMVGAGGGAFAGSLVPAQGEVYLALKEAGVDPMTAAKTAVPASALIAGLDSVVPAGILLRLGGLEEVKREISRGIIKRLTTAALQNAGKEGITEALQEAIKDAAVSIQAGKDFWTADNFKGWLNSFAAGVVGGATLGSVEGIQKDKTTNPIQPGTTTDAGAAMGIPQPAPAGPAPNVAPRTAAPATAAPEPIAVQENVQVFQPRPEDISGAIEIPATPTFYSPMKRFVEEKGQNTASAEQWLNTIRNAPGVKQEELVDTGILDFLNDAKDRGEKITKGDLIREMEERSIRLEERELAPPDLNGQNVVLNEAKKLFAENMSARARTGRPDIGTSWETASQITRDDFLWQAVEMLKKRGAQYEAYSLPGDYNGYTELTLSLPQDPNSEEYYVAPHFGNVRMEGQRPLNENLLAHARMSDRLDRDGNPVMMIEEIQSDWHQTGRREGYRTPEFLQQREETKAQFSRVGGQVRQIVRGLDNLGFDSTSEAMNALKDSDPVNWEWDTSDQLTLAQEYHNLFQQTRQGIDAVPNAPFKSSWDELTFKRLLRWAADRGYRRIAIASGRAQAERYGALTAEQRRGMNEFYDKKMPSMMKKWAKRLGGRIVESRFEGDTTPNYVLRHDEAPADNTQQAPLPWAVHDQTTGLDVEHHFTYEEANQALLDLESGKKTIPANSYVTIELPQHGLDTIRDGLPQYNLAPETNQEAMVGETTPDMMAVAEQLVPALNQLLKNFKLDKKVQVFLHKKTIKYGPKKTRSPNSAGLMVTYPDHYEIHVSVAAHPDATNIWTTMTHELGHVIERVYFRNAPAEVKASIKAAYDEWRANIKPSSSFRQLIATRDSFVGLWWRENGGKNNFNTQVKDISRSNYWSSFDEWFAEQVARWSVTNQTPLTTVERFFSGLSKTLMRLWAKSADIFNLPFQPAKAVADYLNSFHTEAPFTENIYKAHDFLTQQDNQRHMGAEEAGVPMQPETAATRERLEKLFEGNKGFKDWFKIKRSIAYADKFSWLYRVFFGIHQIAQRNPHIASLQQYVEVISVAQLTKQQIMSGAHDVIKQWNQLGRKRSDNLGAFIDDINNMVYRTPDEVKKKISRMPTQVEFDALVTKHGLDAETLAVFRSISASFRDHLTRYQAVLMKEASKITDANARNQREQEIVLMIAALRNKPYFPAMRFGNYTVTVRDPAGNVIHFETFETKRRQKLAAQDIQKTYNIAPDKMQLGYLADQAQPLLGVPTQLLDLMGEKLKLSQAQKDALQQLKFELSPAQSFKHRFQHKRRIAGYSKDFRRAYANYFFHGANHMMKVMYADDLRLLAKATRNETRQFDATKRHQIANAMGQHLENWLDPKSDWMAIRSIAFLWSLAFSPAAATQNLMQTVMTSYPFLASKFGDHKAVPMLMRVMGDWTSFYKRGTYENMSGFEYQAISKGIQEGVITEAMAPELAGIAEGGNFSGAAGETFERGFTAFNEMGSKMFEYAEQVNRRIVFRAALKLAEANPNSKYVKEMVVKHGLKYKELRGQGWTEAQAAAYVTALDATHETQFRYGREFAPRFMQGGALRTVFVFKTFITSYCIFLGHYPTAAVRSLLMLGFLGGLMAQPGAEDIEGIIKAVGWRLFGKDWDVEKEVRKFVIQMAGEDENGRQWADFVLHGAARRGFGWPQFLDMLGGTVGVDVPMPTLDRSRAISGGTLLPADFGALFGPPTQSTEQRIADQTQKASGAVFGAGFNIFKAIVNERLDVDDAKRWERAVPRFMGSVTRSWRYWNEGMERSQTGAPVVKFDTRDWEQLAEIAAVAAGYMPLRVSGYWDKTIAKRDEDKLWDIRRQVLMRQAANAVRGGDEKEIDGIRNAINTFNDTLPEDAKGKAITKKSLDSSIKMRERQRAATESGVPMRKGSIPIYEAVDRLYPNYEAIVKKVR